MKVVEKLFNTYLQVSPEDYVNKYISAMSVLAITEPPDSIELKRVRIMRDRLNKEFPISIFKATRFLQGKETRLTYMTDKNKSLCMDKSKGHDYKIRDCLGVVIEDVNTIVVRSMSKYNTDRGRNSEPEDMDFNEYT